MSERAFSKFWNKGDSNWWAAGDAERKVRGLPCRIWGEMWFWSRNEFARIQLSHSNYNSSRFLSRSTLQLPLTPSPSFQPIHSRSNRIHNFPDPIRFNSHFLTAVWTRMSTVTPIASTSTLPIPSVAKEKSSVDGLKGFAAGTASGLTKLLVGRESNAAEWVGWVGIFCSKIEIKSGLLGRENGGIWKFVMASLYYWVVEGEIVLFEKETTGFRFPCH